MESSRTSPTHDEAAAALTAAESARADLAGAVTLPTWFATSLGAAIALQIGTAAIGVSVGSPWALAALAGGLAVFAAVGAVQLTRFRRANGMWLGGLAGRVVLGTGNVASSSYAVAGATAVWAAFDDRWVLVALASAAGGAAYAVAGRRWLVAYREKPEERGRGESALWLAAVSLVAVGGLVLLVSQR